MLQAHGLHGAPGAHQAGCLSPPKEDLRQGLGQVVDLGDDARRQEWERGEKPVKGCVIKKGYIINGAGATGSPCEKLPEHPLGGGTAGHHPCSHSTAYG